MKGLRIALFLLLALNLACLVIIAMPWFGITSPFEGTTEPDRMANQLYPDKLKVLASTAEPPATPDASSALALAPPVAGSEPAASAAASEPQPLASAASSSVAAVPAAPVATASAPAAGPICIAFVKLTPTQSQSLAQRARKLGNALSISEGEDGPSSFWVNIPPQGGKEGADRRAAELKELGLEDFFIVKEKGESQFAISLGLFHAESLAQRQLETLLKRGVKGATVTARKAPNNARLELTGAAEQIERLAKDGSADLKSAERTTCKTPAPHA